MKVSVLVSIYNGADILPITIPSLLNQNYPDDLTEIILVDDASTDDTPSILNNPEWMERFKTIRHPENRGRTATRNSGIDVASGDLFIFIDCDIEVGPTFISQHVDRHKDKNSIGILSNVQPREMNSKDKYHRYLFSGRRGAQLVGKHRPLPFKYFIMTCSSIKSSAVDHTGKFNENLPSYGIDLEYAYRLWNHYPNGLFYSPEIVVYMHKVKTLSETLFDFRNYGRRNVPVILQKFPELAPYVGADFVLSSDSHISLKTLAGTLLINSPMTAMAKKCLSVIPYPISNIVIRYLMLSAAVNGYRKSLKNNG